MNRVVRSVLAVALVGGVLVACTPDDAPPVVRPTNSAPVATPSATAAPSPSASPVVDVTVAPARPDALDAKKPSKEGAVAVATYFLTLYPYAYATGDLTAWNALSDPACIFCKSARENVTEAATAGTHDVGGAIAVHDAHARENVPGESYEVVLDFEQSASKTIDSVGKVVAEYPAEPPSVASVIVHWSNGAWSVRGVDVAPGER